MAPPAKPIGSVFWVVRGLLWTVTGLILWFFLLGIAMGPCPREGQYTYPLWIAHAIGLAWILGGWIWVGSEETQERTGPPEA